MVKFFLRAGRHNEGRGQGLSEPAHAELFGDQTKSDQRGGIGSPEGDSLSSVGNFLGQSQGSITQIGERTNQLLNRDARNAWPNEGSSLPAKTRRARLSKRRIMSKPIVLGTPGMIEQPKRYSGGPFKQMQVVRSWKGLASGRAGYDSARSPGTNGRLRRAGPNCNR
jgi:hypothetical protein